MPQPAGLCGLEAGSIPCRGQQGIGDLRQAGGQGDVSQTPGLLSLHATAESELEPALHIGVVPVAECREEHRNRHRILRENCAGKASKRTDDGGKAPCGLEVQEDRVISEVLAGDARCEAQILE
jgi:hypothetical protein